MPAERQATSRERMSEFETFRHRFQSEIFAGMPAQVARLRWDAGQLADIQRSRLRALLAHAMDRSPFHARRLAGIDPASFELADLPRLPTMTKDEMMAEFGQVVTDPRLTRDEVEQALAATTSEPVALFGEYTCLATGGSSGRRGVFVSDVGAGTEFFSMIMRPSVARGLGGGGARSAGTTIAFVGAASPIHATGFVSRIMAGSPVTFLPVPVTLPLAEIVARLNAVQAQLVFGYPSMLARLAREQLAGRLRITPAAFTSTSETLVPEYRCAIAEAFGVPVVDSFGTTEGLVGSSEPDGTVITLASDGCIAELVDARNRPVPPGVPSAKVLVTNLYNRVQPLIRYELADSFTREPDAPGDGHVRVTVQGRADEILHFQEADIHPLVLRSALLASAGITDYQVRQTPAGMEIDVLCERPVDLEPLKGRLCSALTRAGLRDPDVRLRAVSSLPRNGQTGKLRRFVPLDASHAATAGAGLPGA